MGRQWKKMHMASVCFRIGATLIYLAAAIGYVSRCYWAGIFSIVATICLIVGVSMESAAKRSRGGEDED